MMIFKSRVLKFYAQLFDGKNLSAEKFILTITEVFCNSEIIELFPK